MTDRRLAARVAAGALLAAALLRAAPAAAVEGIIFSGSVYVDQWGFPGAREAARRSPQAFAPATSPWAAASS